jgi:hypothetical protein
MYESTTNDRELVPGNRNTGKHPSIVDLLSLIDHAHVEGFTVFPAGGAMKLRDSRALLEAAIVEVLIRCSYKDHLLKQLCELLLESDTCAITTNYDTLWGTLRRVIWCSSSKTGSTRTKH